MVHQKHCDFNEFLKVHWTLPSHSHEIKCCQSLNALLFAAMISGQVQSAAPDYKKATSAARRLYRIIMSHKVGLVQCVDFK